MLKKLDYKNLTHQIKIEGSFKDTKDSFYFISQKECWHVTFKKVDGRIEEWVRELILMDGLDDVFLSEVDFRYNSKYKTMAGPRRFISKLPSYGEYKFFINEYLKAKSFKSFFAPKDDFNYGAPF